MEGPDDLLSPLHPAEMTIDRQYIDRIQAILDEIPYDALAHIQTIVDEALAAQEDS